MNGLRSLCLPKSTLLVSVGSKDCSWEELACEALCSGPLSSTSFSLNSCSHSNMSEYNRSPCSVSWFLFLFGFLVGLVNGSSRSVRSTCELDTGAGRESIPLRSSRALVSLSLDTVVDGEVDELEEDVEDVGWSISCLEGVINVEESVRTRGRTHWQVWIHDKNEVACLASCGKKSNDTNRWFFHRTLDFFCQLQWVNQRFLSKLWLLKRLAVCLEALKMDVRYLVIVEAMLLEKEIRDSMYRMINASIQDARD